MSKDKNKGKVKKRKKKGKQYGKIVTVIVDGKERRIREKSTWAE